MEKLHNHSQSNRRDIFIGVIAVLVIAADQITKYLIKTNIAYGDIWKDFRFFQIVNVRNTGASFGIFAGHINGIIVVVFIEIAIILLLVFLLRNRLAFMENMLLRTGIGLVLGGAIGNQIDRIAFGYVTDFLDWKVWPVSNVADVSAVIGTIMIAYCIVFRSGMVKRKNE
jgi:signal peptidase II